MRSTKQIKAVLFDFDDTLIDWSKAQIASWKAFNDPKIANVHRYLTAKNYQLPPEELFIQNIHLTTRHAWEEAKKTWAGVRMSDVFVQCLTNMGVEINGLDVQEMLRSYGWEPIPGVQPFDDAHEVLAELKTRGYKIGLITNSYQPMWMRDIELEMFDMMKYFDARITSGDTRFMKPHPAIYWRMLGMLHLTPEEAVFVGDRPENDIQGANMVGMISVHMNPPHVKFDLNGIIPNYTITQLQQLLPILEQLG